MTVLATHPVDEPDLLALIADEWTPLGKPFSEKFQHACREIALEHGGDVDPNLVRARLLNDPDYSPRSYSAQWAPACGRDGFLDKTDVFVPISGEGSRHNAGKSVRLRRWRGELS